MPSLHLCIVSDHAEANLIPLMQYRPEVAILVASRQMQDRSEQLQRLLTEHLPGMETDIKHDLPDDDIQSLENFALDLETDINNQYPEHELVYNVAGGTKVMALVFSQVFESKDNSIIYPDSQHNQIQYLAPKIYSEPMEPVLSTKIYLAANQKTFRQSKSDQPDWREKVMLRQGSTRWLAKNAGSLSGFFGNLNYLIHMEKVVEQSSRQQGSIFRSENSQQILTRQTKWSRAACKQLSENNLLGWIPEQPQNVIFLDLETTLYLTGGWLEEYAWLCFKDAGAAEVHSSLEITDMSKPKADIRNEIDCLGVHNNRMLIIECKTGNLVGEDKGQKTSDMFTKLDSLGIRSSGLFGSKLLLSAQSIDRRDIERNSNRAKSLGIHVVAAEQLKSVPQLLKNWVASGHL